MVQVVPIDLVDAGIQIGSVQIVRAEWWKEAPRFVLLRYAVNGSDVPYGVRMDMDKRAILDHLDDPALDKSLQNMRASIWKVVAQRMPKALGADLYSTIG